MKSYRSQLWGGSGGGGGGVGGGSGGGGGLPPTVTTGGRFENIDEANLSQKLFKHHNTGEMDCDYSKLFYAKRKCEFCMANIHCIEKGGKEQED